MKLIVSALIGVLCFLVFRGIGRIVAHLIVDGVLNTYPLSVDLRAPLRKMYYHGIGVGITLGLTAALVILLLKHWLLAE